MARAVWSVGQRLPSACCDLVWQLVAECGSVSCVQWHACAFHFRWIQGCKQMPAVLGLVVRMFIPAVPMLPVQILHCLTQQVTFWVNLR